MKQIFLTLLIVCFLSPDAYSASVDRVEKVGSFVCNVLLDDKPVKELDGIAVIPFNSEYKLLLKNNNNRRAVARITIDGSPISNHGDLVISANSEVTLERYIMESLEKGKRFKFVPLDHPEVDDPSREENGLIRVEFKIEEQPEFILYDDGYWRNWVISIANNSADCCSNITMVSDTSSEPGATIGGSESNQRFSKVNIDLEDKTWIVEIRLRGINK